MTEDNSWALAARLDCRDVVEDYTQAVNDGDVEAFIALFTPDAHWLRPGTGSLYGHAQFREVLLARDANRVMRHVTGGIRVRVISREEATSVSQSLVFIATGTGPLPAEGHNLRRVVEYRDRLRMTEGGWKFAERLTAVVYSDSSI